MGKKGNTMQKTNFSFAKKRTRQMLFYAMLVTLPLIQFCIMYIGVNFRSILFAFQKYDAVNATYHTSFENFKTNITTIWNNLFGNNADVNLQYAWRNTLISYSVGLVNTAIGLVAGFFIFKKLFFAGYFRILLYIPNVISGFVTVFGFRYFIERGLPVLFPNNELFSTGGGLLANPETSFWTLTFYSLWSGFGGSLLMTTGQMSRTDKEVLEAAKIDGVNMWQEFIHIVWPTMYPVTTIGLYTGITGLFLAGPPTFVFFRTSAGPELYTFGYYMFTLVVSRDASGLLSTSNFSGYTTSATMGLMFTLIAAPLVFLLKHWFEKHDPNN